MKARILSSLLASALVAAGLYSSLASAAEDQKWLVRLRAVRIDTANQSDPIPALGVTASDTVHVSNKTIPELDISYFLTKNWAAELVLTYPQKHDVNLVNNGTTTYLGTFKHLPPTLSLQYHFMPDNTIKPYVGVGVNYTRISSVNLAVGASPLELENSSFGLALGAGVDVKVANNVYLNFDVKKVQIRSDVLSAGTKVTEVKIDPWLIGVGVGFKF